MVNSLAGASTQVEFWNVVRIFPTLQSRFGQPLQHLNIYTNTITDLVLHDVV